MIRNLGPKILALIIAAVFWVAASEERREDTVQRTFQVPLEIAGIPSDMVISGEVEDTVTVRVRGPASQVRSLTEMSMGATIDLSGAQSGITNVSIPEDSLNLPRNVEVVSMQPARIRLELETRQQKFVRIRPYLVGAPADGFVIGDIEVRPPNALITGPGSLVEEVTEIPTERVILSGRNATFQLTVDVISDYPLVRVLNPATVDVQVNVSPQSEPQFAEGSAGGGDLP